MKEDMNDAKLDALLRDAAETYNRPPDFIPLDDMWKEIDAARKQQMTGATPLFVRVVRHPWARMAAMLVIGVAIGRASFNSNTDRIAAASPSDSAASATFVNEGYRPVTEAYLGETVALLIRLPGDLRSTTPDSTLIARADDLLLQTRLLLDSPASTDPAMRSLLEDLEMMLVQIVRLRAGQDSTGVELLHDALEQRDVIPRLRKAVAGHAAD